MNLDRIREIPILKNAFLIINAYSLKGNLSFIKENATIDDFKKRIGKNLLLSFLISIVIIILQTIWGISESYKPHEASLSIYPNLLGFGIGVFALLFVLPHEFITRLNEKKDKNKIPGAQILPADMSFPLLVFLIIIFLSFILSSIEQTLITTHIATFLFVYGMVITLELVTSIFMTAAYIFSPPKSNDDQTNQSD